jgi:hypothetical protein
VELKLRGEGPETATTVAPESVVAEVRQILDRLREAYSVE